MNIDQLTRGCASVEPRQDLKALLASDRPLRVKLGIDPTSPDLHLGHAVPLALLQRFVEAGQANTQNAHGANIRLAKCEQLVSK